MRPSRRPRRLSFSSSFLVSALSMAFLTFYIPSSSSSRSRTLLLASALVSSSRSSSSSSSSSSSLLGRSLPLRRRALPVTPFVRPNRSTTRLSSAATNDTVTEETKVSSSSSSSSSIIIADNAAFTKPDRDSRQYRAIRLHPNNLQVLLVSAPDSDVQAAAVHVQAGHMDDPVEFPGLAHFHEHLLFLGTQKYSDEHEYEQYLSQHGGSSNAYTDMEDTNYYFSISSSSTYTEGEGENEDDPQDGTNESHSLTALSGALDRLAQFFIAPRFDASMVERELRAVDSEYRNSLTSDAWRDFQLLKDASNPQHAFHKFGCGNYETLTQGGTILNGTHSLPGKATPEQAGALHEFWKKYYVATNLRLCVVGRAGLDELQRTVEKTFGQLPYSDAPRRRTLNATKTTMTSSSSGPFALEHTQYGGVAAFGPDQVGKIRESIPLQERRAIKVYFATPPLDDPVLKESRPYRVISHLLGHESPGSLHALLNEDGLVAGLTSGIGIDSSDFSLFSLTMSLTPKGMKQRDRVLDLVFQWIALIRQANEDGKMEQYHRELREITKVGFQFRENGDPVDFCSSAAELMFDYEPADILVGTSYTGEYDRTVATAFLDRMRPENALIAIVDSDLKAEGDEWNTEEWYRAPYRDSAISEEMLGRWTSVADIDPRLHLPALNEYIPEDFTLRCEDSANMGLTADEIDKSKNPPQLLISRPELRLWHKMDQKWKVPKTFIRLSILSPGVYRSPRTMTLSRLFQRVLNDDLNSYVYDAGVAGCTYRVNCVPTGWRVSVKGYSEKLPHLFDTLTTRILSLIQEMKEGTAVHPGLALKFEKASESLLRETKNYRLDTPYEVASYNARLLLENDVWYVSDYVAEMEGELAEKNPLTMEECARVVEECLMGRVKTEALCAGNIDDEGAKEIARVIDRNLLKSTRPLLDQETPVFRATQIPTKSEAVALFGKDVASRKAPLIFQELAFSESEDNSCAELILQCGCDFHLGFEGLAVLDLISHIAYNSAYNQLRTKEQLGYIVSAFGRKSTGGSWALSVMVQSSTVEPEMIEQRCEAWLSQFRQELEAMDPKDIAKEAKAVVAQLLERDTRLSQEVSRLWGDILLTETLSERMKQNPPFDRQERIVRELLVADGDDILSSLSNGKPKKTAAELKKQVLDFFDAYFQADAPGRRAMSSRVYGQSMKGKYNENLGKPGVLTSYDDISHFKQFLGTWPVGPYWTLPKR